MGLGRATAIALSKAGYEIAVVGRTLSKLEETASIIGGRSLPIQAELTRPDEVRTAFAKIDSAFGRLDALVNNAAAYRLCLMETVTDAQVDEVIDGTLKAPIYCIREAISRMRAVGGGDIVNVSSETLRLPAPYLLLYAAAKAGLECLTDGLRGELKGANIRFMVFQAGTMTESSSATGAEDHPELSKGFMDAFIGGGFAPHYTAGVTPQSMAATIAHMITAPKEAIIDLVRMRHA